MRILWNLAGFSLMGIGIVGYIVPGLPGTVFLIMAMACFLRGGNEKTRNWLLNHKWFGAILRDWDENKWMPLWVKWVSCSCIVVFGLGSGLRMPWLWAQIAVLSATVFGVVYVVTRRTKPKMVKVAPATTERRLDVA